MILHAIGRQYGWCNNKCQTGLLVAEVFIAQKGVRLSCTDFPFFFGFPYFLFFVLFFLSENVHESDHSRDVKLTLHTYYLVGRANITKLQDYIQRRGRRSFFPINLYVPVRSFVRSFVRTYVPHSFRCSITTITGDQIRTYGTQCVP